MGFLLGSLRGFVIRDYNILPKRNCMEGSGSVLSWSKEFGREFLFRVCGWGSWGLGLRLKGSS